MDTDKSKEQLIRELQTLRQQVAHLETTHAQLTSDNQTLMNQRAEYFRAIQELDTLRQISLNITSQLDLDALLSEITRNAVTLLNADAGGIALLRPERNVLEWAIGINADSRLWLFL